MKKFKIAAMLSILTVFMSCSSITIDDYYFKTADLTSYKTFDWLSRPHAVLFGKEGNSLNKDLVKNLLKESVNKQLTARGFSQKSDSPDLLISYLIGAKETNSDDSPSKGGEQNNLAARQYSDGAILLDFLDGKTRELLWRVTAFDLEDSNPTPEKIEKTIKKTVEKMFENFPSTSVR
jgi:hypothetical protein